MSRLIARGSWEVLDAAVQDAVAAGEDGEDALAAALPQVTRDRRVVLAAALGDTRGAPGTTALRAAIFGPGASQDLQCAGLLALAKRNGRAATADLLAGLASKNGAVKSYAVLGLAHVGDDTGWEPVFRRLKQLLARSSRGSEGPVSEVVYALCLLSRTERPLQSGLARLVTLMRRRWQHLQPDEQQWIEKLWPAAAPDGPTPEHVRTADPAVIAAYLHDDPLFQPLDAPSLEELRAAGSPPPAHWQGLGAAAIPPTSSKQQSGQ